MVVARGIGEPHYHFFLSTPFPTARTSSLSGRLDASGDSDSVGTSGRGCLFNGLSAVPPNSICRPV